MLSRSSALSSPIRTLACLLLLAAPLAHAAPVYVVVAAHAGLTAFKNPFAPAEPTEKPAEKSEKSEKQEQQEQQEQQEKKDEGKDAKSDEEPKKDDPASTKERDDAEDAVTEPGSPRAALERFLELTRARRDEDAAAFLDSGSEIKDPARSARRLRAVLDRRVSLDLGEISGRATGDLNDKLAKNVEEIARLPGKGSTVESVRMARKVDQSGWRFSRATVARIDKWYEGLDNAWLLERLPPYMMAAGPLGLLAWQWAALPLAFVIGWFASLFLERLSRAVFSRIAKRTKTDLDDMLLERWRGPFIFAWAAAVDLALLPVIGPPVHVEDFLQKLLRGALLASFFWACAGAIDVGAQLAGRTP